MTLLKPALLRTTSSVLAPTTPSIVQSSSTPPPAALAAAVQQATQRRPYRQKPKTKNAEHRFIARGANLEVHKCKKAEVVLAGPAGTGKSRSVLEKLHQLMLRNPTAQGLMMRKTGVSLTTSAIKTWERDVINLALLDGSVKFHGGSAREPAAYKYSNGSAVVIGGMDNPLKIMSTEYDVIYVQEGTELSLAEYEMANSRLRNGVISFQQMLIDCNPDAPTHWLRERCLQGKALMLNSAHEDNPRYFNSDGTMTPEGAAYMEKLDALTGVRYLRLRKGLWASAEGVIFEGFDPSLHLLDRFDVPKHWRRFWSIDFGYTNPFVWQEWAEDNDGRLYLVQEIYRTKRLVEDHCKEIQLRTLNSPRPQVVICDHDAEDRATFEKHMGIGTKAADKRVSVGLQATQSRYKLAGDGKPRIYILKGAVAERDQALIQAGKPTSTETEVPGYIWNEKKDAPVKENDHGCDAKRYIVAERDLRGKTRVRWG